VEEETETIRSVCGGQLGRAFSGLQLESLFGLAAAWAVCQLCKQCSAYSLQTAYSLQSAYSAQCAYNLNEPKRTETVCRAVSLFTAVKGAHCALWLQGCTFWAFFQALFGPFSISLCIILIFPAEFALNWPKVDGERAWRSTQTMDAHHTDSR